MKRFDALTTLFLFLLLLLFMGCKGEDNPVTPSSEVDQRLIGTWVKIDSIPYLPPVNFFVSSFTITSTKDIIENGWEFATGRLVPMRSPKIKNLIKASDGTIVYNIYDTLDTYSYRFESIFLILKNGNSEQRYRKTLPNITLFPIINCSASFNFLNREHFSRTEFVYPSVTMFPNQGYLSFFTIRTDDYILQIQFFNFNGVGSYPLRRSYTEIVTVGDEIRHRFELDSSKKGSIVFESYDPVNRAYSGSFNFTVKNNTLFPDSITTFEVKNGKFVAQVIEPVDIID
ncbi:MAG: hypothetical protein L6Q47_10030 [Ignavibacteriaceae bacterium]|nr:hypothetical protein [Ignavibacteriaceae bacterium]